jgi:hypothetical protein
MSWNWVAPNPDPQPTPPDLRSHPVPITDLLAQIHDPPARTPRTEQPATPEPHTTPAA